MQKIKVTTFAIPDWIKTVESAATLLTDGTQIAVGCENPLNPDINYCQIFTTIPDIAKVIRELAFSLPSNKMREGVVLNNRAAPIFYFHFWGELKFLENHLQNSFPNYVIKRVCF